MHKSMIPALAVTAMLIGAGSAQATDIVNGDEAVHEVTVTVGGESHIVTVGPMSEIQNVCDGCELAVGEDAPVEAAADAVVTIIEGHLVIE
ncbi:MAG: hypothetical protein HQL35_03360 [Alphaproteobacteria bacterium]|nr:hypothetical protein [Alphaproteobacteria bacterium]